MQQYKHSSLLHDDDHHHQQVNDTSLVVDEHPQGSPLSFEFLPPSNDFRTSDSDQHASLFELPALQHDPGNVNTSPSGGPSSLRHQPLRLTDLATLNERNQQHLIQSWVGGGDNQSNSSGEGGRTGGVLEGASSVTQRQSPGNTTPSLFSPSFLESLQQDDDQSPHPQHEFMQQDHHQHSAGFSLHHHQQQQQPTCTDWSQHDHTFPEFTTPNFSVDTMMPDRARTNSHNDSLHFFASSSTSTTSTPPPPLSPTRSMSSPSPMYGRLSNLSLRSRPNSASSNTQQLPPPTIPEEDDYSRTVSTYDMSRQFKGSGLVTASSRMLHNNANAARLRPIINSYLQSPDPAAAGEKMVIIMTSKVAQKSYGTEKRFLCPPPTAILVGTTWWNKGYNEHDRLEHQAPSLTVCISGEATSQTGQVEWYSTAGKTLGQTGQYHPKSNTSPTTSPPNSRSDSTAASNRLRSNSITATTTTNGGVDWQHNHDLEPVAAGRCVAKNLYINDADEKRKRVECLVRVQTGGNVLGTLASKGIKVISKPSKKRQSVKNMELCIHHGTTVSLFNRIRSQTVSTKYLGVQCGNAAFTVPGYNETSNHGDKEGTCFVARTTSWDPFVIWVVDTSRAPGEMQQQENEPPEAYIGGGASSITHNSNIAYPPPPAIAMRNTSDQPLAIHYNQHIVLQCLTTGLVSPVMIIRKVDKASTVLGGARCGPDGMGHAGGGGGGEYGDEALGDPVSQLHKVALQIVQDPSQAVSHQQAAPNDMDPSSPNGWMMPRSTHPITYLACLNDMVGMHRTIESRKPVSIPTQQPNSFMAATAAALNTDTSSPYYQPWHDITSQEEGKVVRKRRVSTDHAFFNDPFNNNNGNGEMSMFRRRVNSLGDDSFFRARHQQESRRGRRMSVASVGSTGSSSSTSNNSMSLGAFWCEDVTDAAVWTIVGTDCATYRFWSPHAAEPTTITTDNNPSPPPPSSTHIPFPSLNDYTVNGDKKQENSNMTMTLHGENFTRDMQVWFADVKAPHLEYRGRELCLCHLPPRHELVTSLHLDHGPEGGFQLPILLVRGDGAIVYKTNHYYRFD
ncbi:LAG1-DNAbind-domain-containing protein [Lichtheimia hyalospora FSU 10163]|nr:LAG1-DNAbind-domain-containing protein [Lichtheimia hyalospora FSU 10163]